jgi:hypothetical protein
MPWFLAVLLLVSFDASTAAAAWSKGKHECFVKFSGSEEGKGAMNLAEQQGAWKRYLGKCLRDSGVLTNLSKCKTAVCKFSTVCEATVSPSAACSCEWSLVKDALTDSEQSVLSEQVEALVVNADYERATLIATRLGSSDVIIAYQRRLELIHELSSKRCDGGSGLLK